MTGSLRIQHDIMKLDFVSLGSAYREGEVSPEAVIETVFARIAGRGMDGVWISLAGREDVLAQAQRLAALTAEERAALPLYGLPFAVKDCIDVAGIPTTSACPEFAYTPETSASAVVKLIAAGAIFIGKTNMDQFATGLVGTRTPYGIARNPFNPDYIPGGSSSGSAVAVASGLVSFALGTDTGGSGRVPASYTNTVGLKPTVGKISPRGMVNACRSIDCISIYALTGADALTVLRVTEGYEAETPFSRQPALAGETKPPLEPGVPFRFGIPAAPHLEFFGDEAAARLFDEAVTSLGSLGGTVHSIDFQPLLEVNAMMFKGPLVAERYAAVGEFLERRPGAGDPVVRSLILGACGISAAETFKMQYRLEALKRETAKLWREIDVLLVPTVGRPYTIAEIKADPFGPNFNNGYYTNFVNPLDLAACAIPNGFHLSGVPSGVTFIAPAHSEAFLCALGDRFRKLRTNRLGAL